MDVSEARRPKQLSDESTKLKKLVTDAMPDNAALKDLLGRADSQIKSRGYRIELGEIEAALNAIGYLLESAVVAVPTSGFEGSVICSAYAPAPGKSVTHSTVRQDLGKVIPSYMLPSRWLALDRLPKNANGKIDRPQLRRMFEGNET